MLRATTVCTFSTSQLPKVVRTWCVLHTSTWKCASRPTACNFSSLIWSAGSAPAALAILLFDPPKPRTIVFVHPYVQCNTLNWKIMHLNICSGTVQMPFFSWNVFYPKSKTIPTGPAARARSGKRTVTGCAKNRSSHTKPYTPVIGYICIWYMYPNIFIQGFMPC